MKKLNASGISHLLIPLMVFVLVGVIGGTYFLRMSHAASNTTTSSSTSTSTTTQTRGPFEICTHNGNLLCLGDDNAINIGDRVIEEVNTEARHINITNIDSNCSSNIGPCFRVYLSFSVNGDRLGTSDNCDGWVYAGSPSDNSGTVWWGISTPQGTTIYENQHCHPFTLMSDNTNENRWQTGFMGMNGWYWQLDINPV